MKWVLPQPLPPTCLPHPPTCLPHPQECGHLQAASEDLRALVSTKEETEQKHLRTIEGLREEVQHLKGVELMQRERVVQQGSGKALLEENRALRTERERLRGAIKEFDTELAQVSGGKGVEGKGGEWRGGERRGGEGRGEEARGGEGRGEEGGEGSTVLLLVTSTVIASHQQIQQDAHDLAKDRDNFKILYEQVAPSAQVDCSSGAVSIFSAHPGSRGSAAGALRGSLLSLQWAAPAGGCGEGRGSGEPHTGDCRG